MQPILTPRDIERFWSKVAKTQTCWHWTGRLDAKGYGHLHLISDGRRMRARAHRVSLQISGVEVPDDLVVDHICRVRHCVNPEHLRVVTQTENTLAGIGITAINARKTHCPRGHEYTAENTSVRSGKRHCRACHIINQRAYLARKKDAS